MKKNEITNKKPLMFYCGIALSIISLIVVLQGLSPNNIDPSTASRGFGGVAAGIVLAIIGYSRSKK